MEPIREYEEDDGNVEYYAAEPQENQQRNVVLVSTAAQYNGLYGQPTASSRSGQDNYIPSSRASLAAVKASAVQARQKVAEKAPPVQTIRNYNKVRAKMLIKLDKLRNPGLVLNNFGGLENSKNNSQSKIKSYPFPAGQHINGFFSVGAI